MPHQYRVRINKPLKEAISSVLGSVEATQKSWQKAAEGLRRFMEASEKNAENLARMGWTLPVWASPQQTIEIYNLKTEDEVESYFLNVYREDKWGYAFLKEGLLSDENLDRWQPLIRQSFRAFERGDHQIVIPALLSIFEGLVSELSGRFEQKPNVRQATRHKLQESSGDVENWIATSIHVFVSEAVFKSHSFKQERPNLINRHWILHGRDHTDWSKVDALKLFHAIQTVSMLWR